MGYSSWGRRVGHDSVTSISFFLSSRKPALLPEFVGSKAFHGRGTALSCQIASFLVPPHGVSSVRFPHPARGLA